MSSRFQKLTRANVKALAAGSSLTEHGIAAERQKGGAISYSINVMVDGVRVHKVVGRDCDGVTREQAEQLIEKLKTEAREGRLHLPKARKLHPRFDTAAEDYLDRLSETSGKDLKNKARHIRLHLIPHFKSFRLDQITEYDLKHYRKKRLDAGAKDATVNREFSTILHLLNRAVEWKWISIDRKPKVEKPREARKQIRVLTVEQSESLMQAAVGDEDSRLWLFVAFGLGASMRHSEIMRVRYDQIDFATRRIWVPKAKAGEREQPITAALADALARQRQIEADKDGFVFPIGGRGRGPHRRDMRIPFRRAVVRAKLDPQKVTPHIMRHTAITRLVQAGADIPTIQRISAHKTAAMVLHYTHIHGQHIDNALQALDALLPGAITPKLHEPVEAA